MAAIVSILVTTLLIFGLQEIDRCLRFECFYPTKEIRGRGGESIVILLACLFIAVERRFLPVIVFQFTLLCFIYASLVTYERTQLLSLLVLLASHLTLRILKNAKIPILTILLTLMGLSLMSVLFSNQIFASINEVINREGTLGIRLSVWSHLLAKYDWVWGVGLGNLHAVVEETASLNALSSIQIKSPHNALLRIFIELGLFRFTIFILLFVGTLRILFRPGDISVVVSVLLAYHCQKFFSVLESHYYIQLWCLIAFAKFTLDHDLQEKKTNAQKTAFN